MEISLRGASHLAKFIPPSGRLNLGPGSTVRDVLRQLSIDDQLVMLVVIDGELGDIQNNNHFQSSTTVSRSITKFT